MAATWGRLAALILKEFLAVLRDRRGRLILVVPPLAQLLVFSYAATLDVTRAHVMVLNRDQGTWGQELVDRIAAAPVMTQVSMAHDPTEVRAAIDRQRVIAALEIGPDFSRAVVAGRPAPLALILDGRRSNAAQIVAGDIAGIVDTLAAEMPAARRGPSPAVLAPRLWFNPALLSRWAMVPGLVAIIALLTGLVLTALSVAREREMGTFDQLMVSPLRTAEILVGKMTPPLLIGLAQMGVFIAVAVWGFHIPLRGSLLGLYGAGVVYLAAVVGLGLFISALSMTQQQAILGAFLMMVPTVLLSGFATPIDSMPAWLRPLTLLDPLRYFLVIVRGAFLRAAPPAEILANVWPLVLIAIATLAAAALMFRRRLE